LVRAKQLAFPELTRSVGIQLDERVSLSRHTKSIA
jgi:hypothetical protein